jgi:iron complex outermembrane receptor protein
VYSEGYKQGGFNGRPLAGPSEVTAYQPEQLNSYEAGMKLTAFDARLTANLAVFYSEYDDIQLTVNQTPTNFVANAAAGEIKGFELELAWRPVSWCSANASAGNVDASYTEVGQGLGPTQILPIRLTSKFVKTRSGLGTLGAEVSHRFSSGEVALRADASTYTCMNSDVANTPIISDDGYTLVNARLRYRFADAAIEVAVFGNNLKDELYLVSDNASVAFGLAEASYGRPREWGLSASYQF